MGARRRSVQLLQLLPTPIIVGTMSHHAYHNLGKLTLRKPLLTLRTIWVLLLFAFSLPRSLHAVGRNPKQTIRLRSSPTLRTNGFVHSASTSSSTAMTQIIDVP